MSDTRALKKLMQAPEVTEFMQEIMPELLKHMLDLARGVVIMEERLDEKTGDVVPRIYRLPPDKQALQFLIENGIGKVPNRVEMTGKDGERLEVTPWMPIVAIEAARDRGETIDSPSIAIIHPRELLSGA